MVMGTVGWESRYTVVSSFGRADPYWPGLALVRPYMKLSLTLPVTLTEAKLSGVYLF